MPRIEPVDRENPPAGAEEPLAVWKKKHGKVNNILATVAHAPAALKSLIGMMDSMAAGDASLSTAEQEAIYLYVSEYHDCTYCTAAHTAKCKMHKFDIAETVRWRQGKATDTRTQAVLDLAKALVDHRGHVSDTAFQAARDAGLSDADMIEVTTKVCQSTLTNYIHHLTDVEIDFPAAPPLEG